MLGFLKRKKDPKAVLDEILEGYDLPTFPAVVTAALAKLRDERSTGSDIGDVVSSDPGLSAGMLKIVNSAAYSLRNPVRSVHHAVSLLGRAEVESILITRGVAAAIPTGKRPGFDPVRFWQTGARRAAVARNLAERLGLSTDSECFTAGLLQDMAIPVLLDQRGEAYRTLLERWRSGEGDLHTLERDALGWDHTVVAGRLCALWGLPDAITDAIESHHSDEVDEAPLLPVRVVSGFDEVDEAAGQSRYLEAARACGIDGAAAEVALVEGLDAAEDIARQFH